MHIDWSSFGIGCAVGAFAAIVYLGFSLVDKVNNINSKTDEINSKTDEQIDQRIAELELNQKEREGIE